MKLEIVPGAIKFSYKIGALNLLLRKTESTIRDNKRVFDAVLKATNRQMTDTARRRYGPDVSQDKLLQALTSGNPPVVSPMHQMYAAQGVDPDFVMRLSNESPPRIFLLAELLVMWQKTPGNFFLTRQLISILSMGLVNFLLDSNQLLGNSGRDIMLDSTGTPAHLKKFAAEAFGSLGWSRYQYGQAREVFEAAGYNLPIPNAAATHP